MSLTESLPGKKTKSGLARYCSKRYTYILEKNVGQRPEINEKQAVNPVVCTRKKKYKKVK
jgi:hypothetical protein